MVYIGGWVTHIEAANEDPLVASFGVALGGFARVVNFDKRGGSGCQIAYLTHSCRRWRSGRMTCAP